LGWSGEHLEGAHGAAVVLDPLDQPPSTSAAFPSVVVVAQSVEGQLGVAGSQVKIVNIGAAGRVIAADVDQDVSQQMLGDPAVVEKAANELDDRCAALESAGAQIPGGVIGDDLTIGPSLDRPWLEPR
jgi:hypothetical protein